MYYCYYKNRNHSLTKERNKSSFEMSDEGKLYFCLLGNIQIHVAYEGQYWIKKIFKQNKMYKNVQPQIIMYCIFFLSINIFTCINILSPSVVLSVCMLVHVYKENKSIIFRYLRGFTAGITGTSLVTAHT